MIDRWFVSLKTERIYINEYRSPKELRTAIRSYIDDYNRLRPHEALDYATPEEVYTAGFATTGAAQAVIQAHQAPPDFAVSDWAASSRRRQNRHHYQAPYDSRSFPVRGLDKGTIVSGRCGGYGELVSGFGAVASRLLETVLLSPAAHPQSDPHLRDEKPASIHPDDAPHAEDNPCPAAVLSF